VWQLSAQTWTPGATANQTDKATLPPITVTAAADGTLPAWPQIVAPIDLTHASGIGTYTANVVLPATWNRMDGAYLDIGAAIDTVEVMVNGHAIRGIDQSDIDKIDLGNTLHPGTNTISVRVATTLFNAVQTTGDLIYKDALGPLPEQATGLTGPVSIIPYQDAPIRAPGRR
jgi:hypothetical protein